MGGSKELQRFWFGVLSAAYKNPLTAHAILFSLSRGPGAPDLVGYRYGARGPQRMTIPPKLARLPADEVFEALRWKALVDGYRTQPGTLRNEEFDSGELRCEVHVGRRVAQPRPGEVPTAPGWQRLADWPPTQRRLLLQLDSEGIALMSFGGSQLWEDWPLRERAGASTAAVSLREAVGKDTPRMLIDGLRDAKGELWLLDLLALDGQALLGRPFAERQRLLSQEISELQPTPSGSWGVRLWSEQPIADHAAVFARSGATYARDLVRVG